MDICERRNWRCWRGWNEHTDFVCYGDCIAGSHYIRGIFRGGHDCVLYPSHVVKNFCLCQNTMEYLQNKQDFEVYKADVLRWDMVKREKALKCRECAYWKKYMDEEAQP